MAKKKKGNLHTVKEPETVYLTTRILERALRKATRNLTEDAMKRMGYIVTVVDGWVVKKYPDGKSERLSKLPKVKTPKKIALD
jgi:hypothetical protein